jgi:iduronate 2-sulfatase
MMIAALFFVATVIQTQCNERPNVLFIMSDDLRPELSIYDRKHVISPNFERLANRGVVFDRAYSQIPVCFPSRHSLLTGIRPDAAEITTWTDSQKAWIDNIMSILVRAGYNSAGIGKLFHHPHTSGSEYTHGMWHGEWYKFQNSEEQYLNSSVTPDSVRPLKWFRDFEIATRTSEKIKELNNASDKPFLITVGFKQPHLQYHVPQQFFDVYRNSSFLSDILHSNDTDYRFPDGVPMMNYRCCGQPQVTYMHDEGRKHSVENTGNLLGRMVIPALARMQLMWGYLSGVTFLDAMLGTLLDTLDELGIANNTIVVFTSDHGMHVGEKGMWEKYTLWEETTRVPLIIAHPHFRSMWGKRHAPPVELVDVVPTVLDLLGIRHVPVLCPRSKYCSDMDGKSLARHVTGQARSDAQQENSWVLPAGGAVSQVRRCPLKGDHRRRDRGGNFMQSDREGHGSVINNDIYHKLWHPLCNSKNRGGVTYMGYSLRTLNYRYTAWFAYDEATLTPLTDREIVAQELYCHKGEGCGEINSERENLAVFGVKNQSSACGSDDVDSVLSDMRHQLVSFVRNKITFSMDGLNARTANKWGVDYKLDKNNRPDGIQQPHVHFRSRLFID